MTKEIYVSVDVECLGLYPQDYSLASIGACVVGNDSKTFYVELKPDQMNVRQESADVCGFTWDYLHKNGTDPQYAMQMFESWLQKLGGRPVFVGFPLGFDMMWVNSYFIKYLGRNPFGRTAAGIDLKTYAMVKLDIPYTQTTKRHLRDILGSWGGNHTHNALDDAKEQAYLFERLMNLE